MNADIIMPPQVAWATGRLTGEPVIAKTTRMRDLCGVFADADAWQRHDPQQVIYTVERFDTPTPEGALFVGVTRLQAGMSGGEFYLTRGHFHQRREQGEVYFGLSGNGLLLLQNAQGEARLESVCAGSVHIIPGHTAHRLINTGDVPLCALAVWPTVAGHDYAALAGGFAVRVFASENGYEVCHA